MRTGNRKFWSTFRQHFTEITTTSYFVELLGRDIRNRYRLNVKYYTIIFHHPLENRPPDVEIDDKVKTSSTRVLSIFLKSQRLGVSTIPMRIFLLNCEIFVFFLKPSFLFLLQITFKFIKWMVYRFELFFIRDSIEFRFFFFLEFI